MCTNSGNLFASAICLLLNLVSCTVAIEHSSGLLRAIVPRGVHPLLRHAARCVVELLLPVSALFYFFVALLGALADFFVKASKAVKEPYHKCDPSPQICLQARRAHKTINSAAYFAGVVESGT